MFGEMAIIISVLSSLKFLSDNMYLICPDFEFLFVWKSVSKVKKYLKPVEIKILVN